MRLLTLLVAILSVGTRMENLSGTSCRNGAHQQPGGQFAVFVFCDDALGTNIAVFSQAGESRFEKWTLTRRFWQSDAWGADVISIGWAPNRNLLVVTTSPIYGSGAAYLLNLETQTSVTLAKVKDCASQIQAISERAVTVEFIDCEGPSPQQKSVVLPFSK